MPVLRCVLPMLHLEKLCSVNVKMLALPQKITMTISNWKRGRCRQCIPRSRDVKV